MLVGVYETASGTRSLKYIVTPEGRAVKSGSSWDYEYNLTDHLGNVRAVIRKGSNGLAELIQQKHYYLFGMLERSGNPALAGEMSTLSSGISTNKYLYNGKEYQDDFELRWYDYGLRFYDPALARWHSVDPAAELMFSWSPYNYCFGNPIRYEDKDGAIPLETIWDIGNVLYDIGSGIYHEVAGNREAANSAWGDLGMDAAAMLIPYVPAGASKVIKGAKAVDKAVDAAKITDKAADVKKASTITENAKKGKAFEKKVGETLDGPKAEQLTIEAADGTKTRVDFAQSKDGKISLKEAKGSAKAPLTKNQKSAHPQIEKSGGIVRGNKGQDIGLPAGTKIPPTKVEVIRPDDLIK